MNREIKFRGKRIDNGEWVYGYLADEDYINDIDSIDLSSIEVDKDTIGQFTGLFDKSSKEVYEYDYISIVYKYDGIGAHGGVIPDQDCICEGEVVYMEQCSCFGLRLYKAEYPIKESLNECPCLTVPLLQFDLECDSIEVLGNVFDNPELIKKES